MARFFSVVAAISLTTAAAALSEDRTRLRLRSRWRSGRPLRGISISVGGSRRIRPRDALVFDRWNRLVLRRPGGAVEGGL